MKEVINSQETTRKKQQYGSPQIKIIPVQAEYALLNESNHDPGAIIVPPPPAPPNPDDDGGNG